MVEAIQPTGREAVINAKAMFQRVVASWAVDVLALRKRGWDRPGYRVMGRGDLGHAARQGRRAGVRRRAA
jgi:hypothetical protein